MSMSGNGTVEPLPETVSTGMTTDELADRTRIPRGLVLAILDAGLFKDAVQMQHGRPVYGPGAIEVIHNVAEMALEVASGRCSSFNAWLTLRYLLQPSL